MTTKKRPLDPGIITESDKRKLIAIYSRVCPKDVPEKDDPRRDLIAAEMLEVGLASTPEEALQVIAWWEPVAENLKPIVAGVRSSFRRLKLEGKYERL